MEKTIFKSLKYTHTLINGLKVSYPMNHFECKPTKERLSNYGAYQYLNKAREIEWKKCFDYK